MIEKFTQIKNPSSSLIKLIESVGILLGVPLSKKKSAHKAPIPSNYDQTVQLLVADFYGAIRKLSLIQSTDLLNDVAADFYNKMFNCVQLVLLQLQSDPHRVPVYTHNLIVLVNGTRESYVALDTAAHFCRHGVLHIVTSSPHNDGRDDKIMKHLQHDLQRRCKSHFKLLDHCFAIHDAHVVRESVGTDDITAEQHKDQLIIRIIQQLMKENSCESVVLGLSHPEEFDAMHTTGSLIHWATWMFPGDAIFVKGLSFLRQFSDVSSPRTFVVYIDQFHNPQATFLKAIRHCRPADVLVVVGVFPTPDPVGDNRELRFDFGFRHSSWLKTEEEILEEPSCVGWNDKKVLEFQDSMTELMRKSFLLKSRVRIERERPNLSVGQILTTVAFEESASAVLIRLDRNRDLVVQTMRDSTATVVLLK
jgi:hypothetical protein